MKLSELSTNNFINEEYAADNSYVLVNHAASAGEEPVTERVDLRTLGLSIASTLNLASVDQTSSSSNIVTVVSNESSRSYAPSSPIAISGSSGDEAPTEIPDNVKELLLKLIYLGAINPTNYGPVIANIEEETHNAS